MQEADQSLARMLGASRSIQVYSNQNMLDFESYLSPFSWRYASEEMRSIWSEAHKRRLWRRLWYTLAEVQAEFGVFGEEQVEELKKHVEDVDVQRSLEIEAEIHHDLMAELKAYAEQCPNAGGVLHLGATAMDIEDNADALRIRQAYDLLLGKLCRLLLELAERIERWADVPVLAFTHLQPAEPTTLGYRLAQYAQDLLTDWRAITYARDEIRGKGFKGAVGTSASFADLLGVERLAEFEARLSARLGLEFYPVSGQTYPRKQDYVVVVALAGLGGSLYKLAFDVRLLQSPLAAEWAEPFGRRQVGSSAMPFKRNPIQSEKINSLARSLAQIPRLAWDNAAHSLLERTLDDSANRRSFLPEAFLISDELLQTTLKLVAGLSIDENAMLRNLSSYAPFAATERVLVALGKAGADRQVMHERLREHSLVAWEAIRDGKPNPLVERICGDEIFQQYIPIEQLKELVQVYDHIGDAPLRARRFAKTIHTTLKSFELEEKRA